jgi:ribosomal protein RSM22 (predicted rRNA methylase)
VLWTFPAELEEALWRAARAALPAGALEPRALEAAIAERTRRYTSERERLRAPLERAHRARDLAARALFFGVADAAKVAVPLAELAGRGLLPAAEPLALLDVGAGPLAMTVGVAAALPARALAVTAVDVDDDALALGAAWARTLAPRLRVDTLRLDLARTPPPDGPFHLVVAGTVLNELPAAARAPLVRALLSRLAPGGALLVLEPALRDTARALHVLRDELLAAGDAHVFAPCTRAGAPCPALADPDDWCHEDRPFAPPPRLRELVKRTGLRAHGLKLAYLTLRREPAPLVVAPAGRRALRVVSGDVSGKGTVERWACGDEGRVRVRVLARERGPARDALADSARGNVLLVAGPGERPEAIERVEPATPRRR